MKIRLYTGNDTTFNRIVAGITLKDEKEPESGNMALHACMDPANVLANRRKLSSVLGSDLGLFVCPNQTHSSNFHKVTYSYRGRGAMDLHTAIPDVDALYTFEPNLVLCCFTSDCVPVIFYNNAVGLVGIIHSGWKGTVNEITLKLFQHLLINEDCNAVDFRVHIGPAISSEMFEVDSDVYSQFKKLGYADHCISYNDLTGKYHIDNQQTVKIQCQLAGIPAAQILMDSTCTYKSPDGFSYRRDSKCGRHMSFVFRSY
ncbi:MAG TPA: peptidoglycan editing factor PgeF [Bacillota bacterium]|jgi:YfiH family protein|nr:peptidoglycan editing factor PgeF [Bacillota bacterium]